MNSFLAVAMGGAIGSVLRYSVTRLSSGILGSTLPLGTLFVNVSGCFLMGLYAATFLLGQDDENNLKTFLMTGVLGGFTTFSAFSLDVFGLYERGEIVLAFGYIFLSLVLSITALFVGVIIGRNLLS